MEPPIFINPPYFISRYTPSVTFGRIWRISAGPSPSSLVSNLRWACQDTRNICSASFVLSKTCAGWWFGCHVLFPIYWECHHPNWLIFFRGVAQPPTSLGLSKSLRTPYSWLVEKTIFHRWNSGIRQWCFADEFQWCQQCMKLTMNFHIFFSCQGLLFFLKHHFSQARNWKQLHKYTWGPDTVCVLLLCPNCCWCFSLDQQQHIKKSHR